MSDDEDLIDRLEKETLKTKKEAEEEEPDYDIEGELAGKDGEGSDDEGKKMMQQIRTGKKLLLKKFSKGLTRTSQALSTLTNSN